MRNDSSFVRLKRFRGAWVAALALSISVGYAAPAAAEPVFSETGTRNAPPGVLLHVLAGETLDNAGTNPRIDSAVF